MTIERVVTEHYRHGALEQALLEGLKAAGKDLNRLTPDDLAAADEHHIGGRQATVGFAAAINPDADTHVLDIGSGIGGPSRYIAQRYRCRVTGVDLSEEFVAVAASLAKRVGLDDRVSYRQASALELPFADATFDSAYMQHVGMNIEDKARLFNEIHRVLKPNGVFAIFDVMRTAEGPFNYPVPWASTEKANYIATPAVYRALLTSEGFEVVKEHSHLDFALEFFASMKAKIAQMGGLPKLGPHIVMGPDAKEMIANIIALCERKIVAPIEMICRRVEVNPHAGNV